MTRGHVLGMAGAALLLALIVLVALLGRSESSSTSGRAPDGRPDAPASLPGRVDAGNTTPSRAPGAERAPEGRPATLSMFRAHVERLMHAVDKEGVNPEGAIFFGEFVQQFRFIKDHGTEFKEEIRRICLERGGGGEPLSDILRSALPKADADELEKELQSRLAAVLEPGKGDPLKQAGVLSEVAQDASQPIGLRFQVMVHLVESQSRKGVPALGQVLVMLDRVTEPQLRNLLYGVLRYGSGREDPAALTGVGRVIAAVESGTEARGTNEELLRFLCAFCNREPVVSAWVDKCGSRAESALFAWIQREATSERPDERILMSLGYAIMGRKTVPTAEQIAQVSSLLKAQHPLAVRRAGLLMLHPHLKGLPDDPAAQAFRRDARSATLQALKAEKDPEFIPELLERLTGDRDPETRRMLVSLAEDRADLRAFIDGALKEKDDD